MEKNSDSKQDFPESPKSQEEPYVGVGSFILEIVKVVFLAFLIFAPIRFFLFQPFFVQGASMEPNFENNEYLIIREIGYKKIALGSEDDRLIDVGPFKDLERQWPIVFRYPKNPSQYFIKRVIGLPGEKIEIKDGKVKISNQENPEGFVLDESDYLDPSVKTSGDLTIKLDDDQYFVMGDNRMFSSDSRSWGPISKDNIIGKVVFRAWPFGRIDIF